MDLENKLLQELSIYHPRLESFADVRTAVYQARPNSTDPAHQLIDEACESYLAQLVNDLVPTDGSRDAELVEQLVRRDELIERLIAIPEYEQQLEQEQGLLYMILAWAAAQVFGRWKGKPWQLLVELLLDKEAGDAPHPDAA